MKGKTESKMIPPYEKTSPLTREECLCPCCWSVLIEPVTLPCKHSICLACFKQHLNENLCCPCCRERISNWSRRVLKTNKLVNQPFWERLKKELPLFIQARLDGQDSQDVLATMNMECDNNDSDVNSNNLNLLLEASDSLSSMRKPIVDGELVTSSGELIKDYESIHKKHYTDMENRKKEEERASVEFIKKLQEEEWHIPTLPSNIQTSQLLSLSASTSSSSSKPKNNGNNNNGHQTRKLARNLLTEWDGDSILPSSSSAATSLLLSSPLQLLNKSAENKKTNNGENFHLNTTTTTTSTTVVPPSVKTTTTSTNVEDTPRNSILKTPGSSSSSFVFVHGPQTTTTIMTPSASSTSTLKSSEECKSDSKSISFNPVTGVSFHKSSSTPDSINVELCHFRPIRSAPKTPPKRNPDGTYLPEPVIVKSKPIRIRSISADDDETPHFPGSSSSRNIENSSLKVSMEVEINSDPNSPNISKNLPSNTLEEEKEEEEGSVATAISSDKVDSVNDRNHDQEQQQEDSLQIQSFSSTTTTTNIQNFQPSTAFSIEEPEEVSPGHNSDCENQEEGERQNDGDEEEEEEVDDPEKAEREYFLIQALQLEQFNKKKLQEDEDRKFAEMLQKSLNPTHYPVRSRDSSDRYAIRNWSKSNNGNTNANTSSSQQETSTLTTSNSMLSPDSRMRTRKKRSRPTSSPTSSLNSSINNSSSATPKQKKVARTASNNNSSSSTRSNSSRIRGNNRPYNTRTNKNTTISSSAITPNSSTLQNQQQQQQPRKRGRPKKVTH